MRSATVHNCARKPGIQASLDEFVVSIALTVAKSASTNPA